MVLLAAVIDDFGTNTPLIHVISTFVSLLAMREYEIDDDDESELLLLLLLEHGIKLIFVKMGCCEDE